MMRMHRMRGIWVLAALAWVGSGCASERPEPPSPVATPASEPAAVCYTIEMPEEADGNLYVAVPEVVERPAVCLAAVAQLNAHCGERFNLDEPIPAGGGIAYPQWTELDPARHLDVLRSLSLDDLAGEAQVNPGTWEAVEAHLRSPGDRPLRLRHARIDLANTGEAEDVYLVRNWPLGGVTFLEGWRSYAWRDVVRYLAEGRIRIPMGILGTDSIPFQYRGRTYFTGPPPDGITVEQYDPDRFMKVSCSLTPLVSAQHGGQD